MSWGRHPERTKKTATNPMPWVQQNGTNMPIRDLMREASKLHIPAGAHLEWSDTEGKMIWQAPLVQ